MYIGGNGKERCFIYLQFWVDIITTQTMSNEDLHTRIQGELVQSGAYAEIYNHLERELRNSGWYDEFLNLTVNKIEHTDDKQLQLGKLIAQLQDKGIESVPDNIKEDTLRRIAQFLDKVIE